MGLDVRTLAALLAWASLLQAMALGIQYSFSRERESLRWWTVGAFLTTLGFTVNALRDLSGLGAFATFMNTPLLIAGASLNYAGTKSFFKRAIPWKALGATFGIFMAAIAWFTFVQDELVVRRVLLSLVASSLSLLTAKAFWDGQTETLRNSVRFLASIFLAYGIYFFLRGVSALVLIAHPAMANAASGQAIVYFVALTCGILWSYGFILLANQRLAADVQTNETFLSDVIEHNGALIYAKDLEGRYELVNQKWEQVTGLSRRQVLGETDQVVFPGEIGRAFRELDQKVLTSGQLTEHEERLENPEGERWFLSLNLT